MSLERFERVELLPRARAYRRFLDDATTARGWAVATAVTTLFIEGTAYERHELDPSAPSRPVPPLSEHPLVKHYGLSIDHLALTKAHRAVEGDHRQAAWRVVLDHVSTQERQPVVDALTEAVESWRAYRDDVARACGVTPDMPALTG